MDPITMAITAALGKLGEKVVHDAYVAFKAALQHKCGVDSDLLQAVERLEKKPDSKGRIEVLKEEVEATNADKDSELIAAAKDLIAKTGGNFDEKVRVNQKVKGDRNIFSGTGDVNVTGKF